MTKLVQLKRYALTPVVDLINHQSGVESDVSFNYFYGHFAVTTQVSSYWYCSAALQGSSNDKVSVFLRINILSLHFKCNTCACFRFVPLACVLFFVCCVLSRHVGVVFPSRAEGVGGRGAGVHQLRAAIERPPSPALRLCRAEQPQRRLPHHGTDKQGVKYPRTLGR